MGSGTHIFPWEKYENGRKWEGPKNIPYQLESAGNAFKRIYMQK